MHSFRALIGRVVRRQNVICDTPTSLGAREQPDNLILTRLATNAGHRAMSNLHSTIYNLQSHRDLQPHPPHLHPQHDLQLSTCQIPILEPVRLPLPFALQSQAENLTFTNLDPYLLWCIGKKVFFLSIFQIFVPMILISQDHTSTFCVMGSIWAFIALVGSQFLGSD